MKGTDATRPQGEEAADHVQREHTWKYCVNRADTEPTLTEIVAAMVAESRAEQDLPPQVEDPATIEYVARLLRTTVAPAALPS